MKYLALGDSYTVGTSVNESSCFPRQLVSLMNQKSGHNWDVDIIATRGWTTRDLINHLPSSNRQYDLVTLLIGVNDLYDGISFEDFCNGIETLIQHAIGYAAGDSMKVVLLSIPDYTFTPFAQKDNLDVSDSINLYNAHLQKLANQNQVRYIDITDISRRGLEEPDLVASDGLHLSAKCYGLIAKRILD